MRRLLPVALLAALALVGCGDAGALAPSPTPAASSTAPVEPSPSPSVESTRAPTPTPRESEAAAPRRSGPPPAIWLPDAGVTSEVLPAEGAEVATAGTYDLYVQCFGEIEIWNGAAAGEARSWDGWISSIGCDSEMPFGTVQARYGLPYDKAEALAIVEPDSELPLIIRVRAGQSLSAEQRARLSEALADAAAFDVSMLCGRTGEVVRVGEVSQRCARGQERYDFGVLPAGDPLPTAELPEGFDGLITYRPVAH